MLLVAASAINICWRKKRLEMLSEAHALSIPRLLRFILACKILLRSGELKKWGRYIRDSDFKMYMRCFYGPRVITFISGPRFVERTPVFSFSFDFFCYTKILLALVCLI